MFKKNCFSVIIIYLFFYLINSLNVIIFPLQYFYNNNTFDEPEKPLFDILYNSYIYTNTRIGAPEYKIKTFFSLWTPHFSMAPSIESTDTKKSSSYYNILKSNSFQNISCLNKYYVLSKKDISAKEKFIFQGYNLINNTYDEIAIEDLDFVLGVNNSNSNESGNENKNEVYYLTIGLQVRTSYTDKFNLIYLLKEKNITKDYDWFITFIDRNNKKGELYNLNNLIMSTPQLVIGESPHNFSPDIFLEDNLKISHSQNYYWMLYFKNIYYYANDTTSIKQKMLHCQVQFNLDQNYIIATPDYHYNIKNDFFNDYLSKNICYYYNDSKIDIEGYYCDKSEKFSINNLKKFPKIYFEHKEFNYTFELSYQDLFVENNGKYWFLIVLMKGNDDNWFFGSIFFRKYQFVFNPDSRVINFYDVNITDENNVNTGDEDKNKNGKLIYFLVIFGIIISWILFIILGIFIGKYIYKKYNKKLRANELDDKYEYISEKIIN